VRCLRYSCLSAPGTQVLEDHEVQPSILHGNLSPQRTGVVTKSINGVDIKHAYLTGPCSFYGDRSPCLVSSKP
jgi:fructosamine-3-kinase